jgi:hypothetical protein
MMEYVQFAPVDVWCLEVYCINLHPVSPAVRNMLMCLHSVLTSDTKRKHLYIHKSYVLHIT